MTTGTVYNVFIFKPCNITLNLGSFVTACEFLYKIVHCEL